MNRNRLYLIIGALAVARTQGVKRETLNSSVPAPDTAEI
jgi:hypothetical protein